MGKVAYCPKCGGVVEPGKGCWRCGATDKQGQAPIKSVVALSIANLVLGAIAIWALPHIVGVYEAVGRWLLSWLTQ